MPELGVGDLFSDVAVGGVFDFRMRRMDGRSIFLPML